MSVRASNYNNGVILRKVFKALLLSLLLFVVAAGISSVFYQRVRLEQIAPGVRLYHFVNPKDPVNLDVLRISRKDKFIDVRATIGGRTLAGLEPVTKQVTALDGPRHYPVAAINGDFYKGGNWEGMPVGVTVINYEIISAPPLKTNKSPRPAFVLNRSGQPDIVELAFRGELASSSGRRYRLAGVNRPRSGGGIIIYTPRLGKATPYGEGVVEVVLGNITGTSKGGRWKLTSGHKHRAKVVEVRQGGGTKIPRSGAVLSAIGEGATSLRGLKRGGKVWFRFKRLGSRSDVREAIGGWPVLVRRGKNQFTPGKTARHPRTAVGYNNKEIYFAVVDGRRSGWSRGMTYYELGELMLRMKCYEALNLDGGGSSTMWVRGTLRNKVSDGRERPVANALAVTSSAPRTGRLEKLLIDPSELSILTGQSTVLSAKGSDMYYNPVPVKGAIKWSADKKIGKVEQDGVFRSSSRPATGRIRVRLGGLIQYINVEVFNQPPIFQIFPTQVHLFEGENQRFRYLAMDHKALPVVGDYEHVLEWSVTPGLGTVDSTGLFQAGSQSGKGKVSVQLGSVIRHAVVSVGTVPRLVDNFEKTSTWRFSSHPDNKLPGSFSITSRAAYEGRRSGELRYRFDNRFSIEAAYARKTKNLGAPMAIKLWVKGNGSSHQLRVAYTNKYDNRTTITFGEGTLSSTQWHSTVAKIPAYEEYPITLESIYVLKDPEATSKLSGTIYIDKLTGLYHP